MVRRRRQSAAVDEEPAQKANLESLTTEQIELQLE
jgi:hypothetical protein